MTKQAINIQETIDEVERLLKADENISPGLNAAVEWAAKPLLQGWQLCSGMGGSFRLEWVAGLLWNRWQVSSGICIPA